MTNYKKEAPKRFQHVPSNEHQTFDVWQYNTNPTIEHYLAEALLEAKGYDADTLIHNIRMAWDLIPDEPVAKCDDLA